MSEYIREETVVKSEDHGVYRREVVKMSDRRERIVRCRDCSMYDKDYMKCMRDPEHTGRGWFAVPDGFCAWGMLRKRGDRK